MRVDLDATVRTRDGENAGSVQQAVIDPQTNEVTDFVISTGGLFGHDVLISRERLETATRDGDVIRLDLTKDELEEMPAFETADYSVPSTGWIPPAGFGYPPGGVLWPSWYLQPVPSASSPDRDEGQVAYAISKGSTVRDRYGEEIGVVDDVRFDPESGRLRGVVMRAGGALQTFLGGGETTEVASQLVDRVEEGSVYLRSEKAEIERSLD